MSFLKKVPALVWIAILVLGIGGYVYYSGRSSAELQVKVDQLKADSAKTISDKDAWIKDCETNILQEQEKINQIEKEKNNLKVSSVQSAAEVVRLKGEIDVLQKKLKDIVISSDPDSLILDLRNHGLGSIKRKY